MIIALDSLQVTGGLLYSYTNSDIIGQSIVWILAVASMFVWTIMLTKNQRLSAAKRSGDGLLAAYRRAENPASLPDAVLRERDGGPLLGIYSVALDSLQRFAARDGVGDAQLDRRDIQELRSVIERRLADEILLLEDGMGPLATATTTAPFVGLFGTVYGVMLAFEGMAQHGTATLSAVAPGVSGALITTVVALLVAIPTAVGYNVLSERIKRLTVQTENFAEELLSDIQRCCAPDAGDVNES